MTKKDKKASTLPEGYKAYQKVGGGSLRFKNHIIKPGQKFAINPDAIPLAFKDTLKECEYAEGMVVVKTDLPVVTSNEELKKQADVYSIKPAMDPENPEEQLRNGNKLLFNVVHTDGSIVSENPLPKGKANELAKSMNS